MIMGAPLPTSIPLSTTHSHTGFYRAAMVKASTAAVLSPPMLTPHSLIRSILPPIPAKLLPILPGIAIGDPSPSFKKWRSGVCASCVFLLLSSFILLAPNASSKLSFNAIYQFGDSISDTGNALIENKTGCAHLPYGETFFHRPTDRCSNGLIMLDFFAKAFQLPLLNPYLEENADFIHGVNFAVSGATALDISVLVSKNVTVLSTRTNSSLSVQLGWFRTHLKSICSSKEECKRRLGKALFLLEIGGNDYLLALGETTSFNASYKLVPDVVRAIKNAVNEVIDHGAAHVVVTGNILLGCTPSMLVRFASNDTSNYDKLKCVKIPNEFAEFHNRKLQDAVKELQHQHPSVSISYRDLYSAATQLLQNAASLGFEKDEVLKACCGDGNDPYNFNISRPCGRSGVSACANPNKLVSWDGLHYTQQAYKYLASWLLKQNIKDVI